MIAPFLLIAAVLAAAPAPRHASKVVELPEDLGAETIDVSSYPAEYRKIYDEIFLHIYPFMRGGTARAINSPLIELDPAGEEALRREHPELFADPRVASVSPDGWRLEVTRVKNRPPCCGACPVLSRRDAVELRRFLVYDSLRRKTGANAAAWVAARRELIQRFDAVRDASASNAAPPPGTENRRP